MEERTKIYNDAISCIDTGYSQRLIELMNTICPEESQLFYENVRKYSEGNITWNELLETNSSLLEICLLKINI